MSTSTRAGQVGSLPLTGERTVPGIAEENYWFRRHEVVYAALRDALRRTPWCWRPAAARATAPTCSPASPRPSSRWTTTRSPLRTSPAATRRVGVARANLVALPVRDGSCDAVVSLQVIEHLWEQERFLRECRRVLRPGGTLLRLDAEPAHVLPRPGHAAQPVPHPRAGPRRAGRAGPRRRVRRRRGAAGCTTGRGCASWTPCTAGRSSTRRSRWPRGRAVARGAPARCDVGDHRRLRAARRGPRHEPRPGGRRRSM